MAALVHPSSIQQLIDSIAAPAGTLKARLLELLAQRLHSDEAITATTSIAVDELVAILWELDGDEETLKRKRKNFSSLKSALNRDLKMLEASGGNPASLFLNKNNVFEVSAEKKEELLAQMGISTGGDVAAAREFADFRKNFRSIAEQHGWNSLADILADLQHSREEVSELSRRLTEAHARLELFSEERKSFSAAEGAAAETGDGGDTGAIPAEDEVDVLEIGEDDEIVEVGEEDRGAAAETDGDGDTGAIPAEDEVDVLEIGEDDEIVEVGEEDRGGDAETGDGGDAGETPAEDEVDVLEIDEDEEIVEVGEEDRGGAAGAIPAEDEVDILEVGEDEEIVEVGEEDRGGAAETGDGGDTGTIPAEDEVDVLEIDEDEEIVELGEEEWGAAAETGDGGDTGAIPADDEVDILEVGDDEEIVELGEEEWGAAAETGGGGDAGAIPADDEVDVLEIGEDEEIVELGEETPTEGSGPASGSRPSLLDALAEYFDPEQILAADAGETLSEENEEYIAHILGRYTPTFIKIPAGRYRVGSLPPNPQAPLRTVKLPAFYIGQIPVTNDLFELFVRETGYITDAEQQGFGTVFTARQTVHADGRGRRVLSLHRGSRAKRIAGADWRHPGGPATSILGKYNHPVVQVTLQDALAFAAWAGKRLPTVEEWEAAARGSDGRPFPWGPDWVPGLANLEIAMTGDTTPVGGYGRRSAGPFGLLDTLGNVFEWTSSTDARHSNAADSPYLLKGGCWLTADQVDLGVFLSESKDFRANIAGFRLAV